MSVKSLIRVAKLHCDNFEFFCIIRGVHESSVTIKLFNIIKPGVELLLELSNGDLYTLEHTGHSGEQATFPFSKAIDIARFLAEPSPYPKRPARLRLLHPACITFGTNTYDATIVDISCGGAKVESEIGLIIGEHIRLSGRMLPTMDAIVRWKQGPRHGLTFLDPFHLNVIAERTALIQKFASANSQANSYRDIS